MTACSPFARRRLARLVLGLAGLVMAFSALASTTIRYPRAEGGRERRDDFPYLLLQQALAKSGASYIVKETDLTMQQKRMLIEIARGDGVVDVVATMTSREREKLLLPVRIPVDKGLMGWRISLVKAGKTDMLRDVNSLDELKRLRAGQGHDWPDVEVMRANGLQVHDVSDHENLYRMLAADRFEYFPRSIIEVLRESQAHHELETDPYIALHYPAASYFFVNRKNTALADAIRRGLEAMIADGSFDKLFYEHYGESLRQARLAQRRIIHLTSPLLPDAMPLERKELWLSPTK